MPHAEHVIRQARRDIDAALEKAKGQITCRGKGCSWCCYQPVAMHPAELDLLQRRVPAEVLEAAAARIGAFPRCPLLGDDGACTIYAERPLACRMHAVGTPPEDCDTVNRPGRLVGRLASTRAIYARALAELGPMDRPVILAQALTHVTTRDP